MKNKKIKILVVGHKNSPILCDEIYVPIQAGREISKEQLPLPWIGDNTGENISKKNGEYCELTAMYWAWKNYEKLGNPEYIGLCHYRRYFSFQSRNKKRNFAFYFTKITDLLGTFSFFKKTYKKYIKKLLPKKKSKFEEKFKTFFEISQFEKLKLKKMIQSNDIIYPERYVVPNPPIQNHYSKYGKIHQKDFEIMRQFIKKNKNGYMESFEKFAQSKSFSLYNMFIMKKKYFFEYCAWIFPILLKIEKITHPEKRQGFDRRAMGLISEFLFNVWLDKKKKTLKTEELNVYFLG